MSIENARAWLAQKGFANRVQEFSVSSATVELAAQALRCEPCRIAKTLSFGMGEKAVLVVMAGDAKVDNAAFKAAFGVKAKMLAGDEVEGRIGHAVGGVCPFGIREAVPVYLDESLRRFDTVYPAAGSANSAVRLSVPELEATVQQFAGWVDVGKGWRD
ncbi:MAG: YbaK/EbsC family protein [Clostridia bacterium]|nr:YbaK/EbsC family protein [Clostridia bacterium]